MTLDEIHEAELLMMSEIDAFCTRQRLTYYLAYGTLLGAVRHSGFIPWDDDVDLWMPRMDFDTFVKTYGGTKRYRLVRPYERGYPFAWAKLLDTRTAYDNPSNILPEEYGLTLDIFPLDTDYGERRFRCERAKAKVRRLANCPPRPESNRYKQKRIAHMMLRALSDSILVGAKRDITRLGLEAADESLWVNYFGKYSYARDSFPKKLFGSGKRIPFDGLTSGAVAPDYSEELLIRIYGSNWRMPVVDARHARVFWREGSHA